MSSAGANEPRVCVIIPAKERSTRILGKNVKDLCGKPMMAYIIEAAKAARGIDRVIVTTESSLIQQVAEKYGAEVPFLRPVALTEDAVTSQEVLAHAIGELEKQNYVPDYVLLLYPTSPFLKKERIEEAIEIARERESDSVVSGSYDKGHYWIEGERGWERFYPKDLRNSQYQKPLFVENGAIYLTKTTILKQQLVADVIDVLVMEPDENIDVDYPVDWQNAEARMRAERSISAL